MAPIGAVGTDNYPLIIDCNEKAKSFIGLLNEDEKNRIFEALQKEKEPIQEKIPCPFPNHKWYSSLWSTLTSEQQQDILENFRISDDGKIEVIKRESKVDILTKQGENWINIFKSELAEQEAKKQWKILLSQSSAHLFVNLFPWKTTNEKLSNFGKLFELWDNFRIWISEKGDKVSPLIISYNLNYWMVHTIADDEDEQRSFIAFEKI